MENVYLLIYIRQDPSESARVAFNACPHCEDEASVMDGLKAKMGLKSLEEADDFKLK